MPRMRWIYTHILEVNVLSWESASACQAAGAAPAVSNLVLQAVGRLYQERWSR